jgi:phosphate transport system protein
MKRRGAGPIDGREPGPGGRAVRRSDTELGDLAGVVLRLGGLVAQQIRDAFEAVLEGKGALARMVQRREDWVDALAHEAHDRVVGLLLERQPFGLELRALLSIGDSARDLEWMGNEAERIARAALEAQAGAAGAPPRELLHDVEATAALVVEIVEGGLSAIAQLELHSGGAPAVVQAEPGLEREATVEAAALVNVRPLPA